MKKLLALLLVIALAIPFAACSSASDGATATTSKENESAPTQNTSTPIRIAVLNGTTGFGIAPLVSDLKNNKCDFKANVDFYADATLVAPLLINGSVDIAAVPTNLAATVYNKTQGKIEVLAVNTLGVLYLLENGETVNSLADLEGKTVYVPGQGTNPEYVLRALLKYAGLTDKVTIDYTYQNPDALTAAMATGKAAIGLLPEPKVTAAKLQNSSLRVAVDFSAEWKRLTGCELVQGCLVARKEFVDANKELVNKFLAAYEASVNTVVTDADTAAKLIVEAGIAPKEALVKNALPRCNITYLTGDGMKNALNEFWSALYGIVPTSIGGKIPDSGIFG
jgi:NitT/TauT family transport system substrate-binding protein